MLKYPYFDKTVQDCFFFIFLSNIFELKQEKKYEYNNKTLT
jgi:hypothetical protein